MTDAWFSPEAARLFSYLSLLSLCSLFAIPARRGQLRRLATGVWNTVIGFGLILLAAGSTAIAIGQPAYVSRSLLISGFVVGIVFASTRRAVMRGYDEAELRRTVAADL
jgi:hypothetical protein